MTLAERLAAARRTLEAAGIPAAEAALDAEVLARTVLHYDRATLVSNLRQPVDGTFDARFAPLVDRRASREPTAYILGRREFWGLSLEVTPAVLVPRPETELIVEEALALFGDGPPPASIIDLCTGSGCLAVVLAIEFSGSTVLAIDISEPALEVARRNARSHGVSGRVQFRNGDLLDGVSGLADLIVSNPPYVATRDAASLPPEVRDHEPSVALFAGDDGLEMYRRLIPAATRHLTPRGHLVLEIGMGQEQAIESIAEAEGVRLEHSRRDLQGIVRTLVFGNSRR